MKRLKRPLLIGAALVVVLAGVAGGVYGTRLKTVASIRRITSYDSGYNLYRMNVAYDYRLDDVIASGIADDQSIVDATMSEALPFLPLRLKAQNFGCSAFSVKSADGDALMGRNYDFKNNTSAMLVYATPKDGYKSVAFAALDNLMANAPDQSLKAKLSCLAAPFVCLDGVNEKGVSIAVLTLDSPPTRQHTGKPVIATTLAIRLVLDKAASTAEAVKLLEAYDMFATSGRDYHFYITDAAGDGRVVEFDCLDEKRPLVATPMRAITNFYALYKDKVLPYQKNGVFGHGRERYDTIEKILTEHENNVTPQIAWKALIDASQAPKEGDVTSNTQWSVLYNNTQLTAEIAIRRDWQTVHTYSLKTNELQ